MTRGLARFMTAPRSTSALVALASLIGAIYVAATFDGQFLVGKGPFWAFPVGPWLMEPTDTQNSIDVLDYLVGYIGLVNSDWTFPFLHVPEIGAPGGTSVVFLDVIPVAALTGRIVSAVTGHVILPYGFWVACCFVLSAASASLLLAEVGQSSFLAAVASAIFAVSAPALLHRFPHFPLMAHFLLIAALWLYCRDRRQTSAAARFCRWAVLIALTVLVNPYLTAMVGAIYGASLLHDWRVSGPLSRLVEPIVIVVGVLTLMVSIGLITSHQTLSGDGFGYFSMNLLSPITPQRSGVLPSWQRIIDATSGQYEGFSYLGMGGLVLLTAGLLTNARSLWRSVRRNPELTGILLLLTIFALSKTVYAGRVKLLDLDIGWKLGRLAGIYRSSGRMFWPAYYAILLGSLLLVLRRLPPRLRLPIVSFCCALQLIDSEPLRARLSHLTDHGGQPFLDAPTWSARMSQAHFVNVYPTFFCSNTHQRDVDMELQLAAVRERKDFNVVYNPRLSPDCNREAAALLKGPWQADTLYVFLDGISGLPPNWTPPNLACETFSQGRWCLGDRRDRLP